MIDRLTRTTTAFAVIAVAGVAAIISYQHTYELVRTHGESGLTARLVPFTVDGLIWAASMVVLDASRRNRRVPSLALWSLGAGIVATIGANTRTRPDRRPGQRMASTSPSRILRTPYAARENRQPRGPHAADAEPAERYAPASAPVEPTIEDAVRSLHQSGASQRAIARQLNIDRRKVKRVLEHTA